MKEKRLVRFDWAIKNILRDKANYDVIEGFLTALLKQDIHIIKILESESNQKEEMDKFNRVDMLVEDSTGTQMIIEIQNTHETHYLERLLYGTSKVITENLKLGEDFKNVKKVISISILYFIFGNNVDDYLYYGNTEFKGVHSNTILQLKRKEDRVYKTVEIKDIFPEYYIIEVEKFEGIVQSDIDEWIYFLKNEVIKDEFKSKNIQSAQDKLDILKMDEGKRKSYEEYLIDVAVSRDMIDTAFDDGVKTGEKIGVEKGEKIGIEKGENRKAVQSAKRMLEDGLSIGKIADYTGLTTEEVERIQRGI